MRAGALGVRAAGLRDAVVHAGERGADEPEVGARHNVLDQAALRRAREGDSRWRSYFLPRLHNLIAIY